MQEMTKHIHPVPDGLEDTDLSLERIEEIRAMSKEELLRELAAWHRAAERREATADRVAEERIAQLQAELKAAREQTADDRWQEEHLARIKAENAVVDLPLKIESLEADVVRLANALNEKNQELKVLRADDAARLERMVETANSAAVQEARRKQLSAELKLNQMRKTLEATNRKLATAYDRAADEHAETIEQMRGQIAILKRTCTRETVIRQQRAMLLAALAWMRQAQTTDEDNDKALSTYADAVVRFDLNEIRERCIQQNEAYWNRMAADLPPLPVPDTAPPVVETAEIVPAVETLRGGVIVDEIPGKLVRWPEGVDPETLTVSDARRDMRLGLDHIMALHDRDSERDWQRILRGKH